MGLFPPGLLASGRLVRVLGDWRWPGGPELCLLYRRMPNPPKRITAFVDFAVEAIRDFDPRGETLEAL